jgi:hypothetical protein
MRKFLFLLLVVSVFAVPSSGAVNIGVNGGYSYSNMDSLDKYWEKVKVDAAAYTTTSNADWKRYGNGIFVNVDMNMGLDKNILAGVRTGVQYIFPSKYSGFRGVDIPPVEWMYTETSIDNYLIPIMAGLSLNMPVENSSISFDAGVYAGWGLAYCGQSTKYNGSDPLLAIYGSGGFMADISAAVEIKVMEFMKISINGGYRLAKMTDFKNVKSISAAVPGYGLYTIPSNDPFNDNSGKPVEVDFSGINIGAGVSIGF